MSTTANPPPSPGVSSRRPGGKIPPKLPLSVFSAAATAPLTADPTKVFPNAIVDANVGLELPEWSEQAGDLTRKPISGVVLALHTREGQPPLDEERFNELTQSSSVPITAIIAPTHLADRGISKLPSYITSSPSPIAFGVSFAPGGTNPDDIRLILSAGHVVDLDVPWNSQQSESDSEWNALEDFIGKAVNGGAEGSPKPTKAIVISNLLPPPHSLHVPIVKLMKSPVYEKYQEHISSLSFVTNVYLKFLPPHWEDPTPPSPAPFATTSETTGSGVTSQDAQAKDEWKRRVRIYLGPALDAFGYSRIIFGTSPSPSSTSASNAHDWYTLAREVVAEIVAEQDGVDAIFGKNAQTVYGQ
ncbi:hypothetical protein M407DRAFT_114952 [Tulasnella calospora MUT 4182]|uniref:Amidohydrolase-related domain-containing protein n=1 Tax=Tulasnella calospora MUT 4182 TaxID=1051891 RepID=A0A0C3Q2U5_9AGAM|nr:hypothetical protein M407DRAFT_114952 [Tulasnella calospora MUT 4182]